MTVGRRAKQSKGKYDFLEAVTEAHAQDELNTVVGLERLGRRTVAARYGHCGHDVEVPVPDKIALRAMQWKLGRKFPERYAPRQHLTVDPGEALHEGLARAQAALAKKREREGKGG